MKTEHLILRYGVKDYPKNDYKTFHEIQKKLEKIGADLYFDNDGFLNLSIGEEFEKCIKRGAGRRKKIVRDSNTMETITVYDGLSYQSEKIWKYSDITLMLQTMTDKQICEKIGMPPTTYYRHKKELKNSSYFKVLDKNRLEDKEYLESIDGNVPF